jgi:pseudaminic acid cytidylyltransferase
MRTVTNHKIERGKALAVIPARGGSVRVLGKNIADFDGEPALARVIAVARDSGVFDQIAVSTDDQTIATCAKNAGADVVLRPDNLSDGMTPLQPVVVHAMSECPDAEFTCLLLATAVMLRPERLVQAMSLLTEMRDLDYVIGVRRFDSPPQRGLLLNPEGFVSMQSPQFFNSRSQDLEPLYHDAGQFSFGRRAAWLSGGASFAMRTKGIVLPREEAIDIDEPEDLDFARLLFRARRLL